MEDSIRMGDLAAVATVVGATIYALGLIGVAIPVRLVFASNISTAWYAASLVSKTVVAGYGAWIWLIVTGVTTTLLFLLSLATPLWLDPGFSSTSIILFTVATVLVWQLVSTLLVERLVPKIRAVELPRSYSVVLTLLGFVGMALIIGALFSFNPSLGPPDDMVPSELRDLISSPGEEPRFLRGSILLFIGSFLLGLGPAISVSPPLPKVQITKQMEAINGAALSSSEGWLVAHSDGFWHLFDETNELVSIPDAQVLTVRTIGKADTTSTPEVAPTIGAEHKEDEKPGENIT